MNLTAKSTLIASRQRHQRTMSRSTNTPADQDQHEHQTLALEWLERQHQAQQNRQSLNEAILTAVASAQQQQPTSLPAGGSSFPTASSTSSDVRNQPYYLDNIELQRHLIQQQQQQQQQQQLHSHENVRLGQNDSLLQQRLSQMLGGDMPNQSTSVSTLARSLGSHNNTDHADLDCLMAAETLLQRSRLQEAIRMYQIQGVLQQEGVNRGNNNFNALGSSGLLIPSEPIVPHTFTHASATNSSPYVSHLLQSGLLNIGQMLPFTSLPTIDSDIQSRRSTSLTKRKSDSTHSTNKEPSASVKKAKSKESLESGKLYSFPLPSTKQSRNISIVKFSSLQKEWDALNNTPLQKEIFLRRLCKQELQLLTED